MGVVGFVCLFVSVKVCVSVCVCISVRQVCVCVRCVFDMYVSVCMSV